MSWIAEVRDRRRCRRAEPMLLAFLDGELGPADAQSVAEHLAACERCGGEARVWRMLRAQLQRLAGPVDGAARRRLVGVIDQLAHSR